MTHFRGVQRDFIMSNKEVPQKINSHIVIYFRTLGRRRHIYMEQFCSLIVQRVTHINEELHCTLF